MHHQIALLINNVEARMHQVMCSEAMTSDHDVRRHPALPDEDLQHHDLIVSTLEGLIDNSLFALEQRYFNSCHVKHCTVDEN